MGDTGRETQLVGWFKALFASRTPPRSVLDGEPHYRVTWTEISMRMRELGYTDSITDLRLEWEEIHKRHRLGAWWRRLERKHV